MQTVLAVMISLLVSTHFGGLVTRAIYITKNQRANRGLYRGTFAGVIWLALLVLLQITGISDADDTILLCILLPILFIMPVWGYSFFLLPHRERDEHHAIIPFYYDLEVLKVFIQVWFAVLFIGSIALLWVSLTTNLRESNVALDFNVYERRFGAAISEGIEFNTEWDWVGDFNVGDNLPFFIAWVAIWLGLSYFAFDYLKKYDRQWAWGALAILILSIPLHPMIIGEINTALAPYLAPSTMTRALITGFSNTLRVSLTGAIAATVLGILLGIGMLSNNYLVRNVANVYVEIFRNTPLLVQLIFVYQAMLIILPAESEAGQSISLTSPASILGIFKLNEELWVLNTKGSRFVNLIPTDTFAYFAVGVIAGLIAAFFVRRWRVRLQDRTGTPAHLLRYMLPTLLTFSAIGWIAAGGYPFDGGPFSVDYPRFVQVGVRSQYQGGYQLSLAFVALFLALTLYTAAFIADIVRAGIQSVQKGQIEAARSLGLNGSQVLSLVIMPQALRLIIPPLGNQYVNLGKNSSLGFAVGFGDTFTAVQLANNESGQSVPFFIGMMVIYLSLSLFFSAITNIVNATTKLRTR